MGLIEDSIKAIRPVDKGLLEEAQARLDSLTKPRGSLGRLENIAKRLVAISGKKSPSIEKKIIFTFASDHGVACEGVSAYPPEVTEQMVLNFLRGGAGINVLARHAGAEVAVVDIGVDCDFASPDGLIDKKVMRGSGNIRKGPAMTRDEAVKCLEVGITLAREYAGDGVVFGTGDMGIANTTPSSAIVAAFTGCAPAEVTGAGTGVNEDVRRHKIGVIEDALKVNSPDPSDPLDVLSKVGGPEIAGIAGLIIGAASERVPLVVDGFISTAGALAAYELAPSIKDYLFYAHKSVERGHRIMLERLGARPLLDLDLRLGEGTGAALAMTMIEAGLKIYNEMATFGEAGVSEEHGE
ncbi:MAG: nicotinate-nucleotide--dimethylbenzimidazole phosphoribosyltransferase [Thermodesulfobacteriota bacterium]